MLVEKTDRGKQRQADHWRYRSVLKIYVQVRQQHQYTKVNYLLLLLPDAGTVVHVLN